MNDTQYVHINNLLSTLHQFNVVELVNDIYEKKFNNSAPGEILHRQIESVQQLLDEVRRDVR